MRGTFRLGLWVAMALAATGATVTAEDTDTPAQAAWRERLEAQLTRVEMSTTALDKIKSQTGALPSRVTALHKRLVSLEKAAHFEPGTVRGVDDLASLTSDVTGMGTRVRALIDDRAPKSPTAPVAPAAKPAPAAAEDPKPSPAPVGGDTKKPPRAWPEQLEFSATAKLTYQETGEWFISKNQRSGLGNDFLMDGYAGTVAFSLRAKGLKKEIVSASIRVAVKLRAPFANDDNTYRIYDVVWTAEIAQSGRFGTDSLKHFPRYAGVEVSGPIEWVKEPKKVTVPLTVYAHVRSITLPGGEIVEFDLPEYAPKQR